MISKRWNKKSPLSLADWGLLPKPYHIVTMMLLCKSKDTTKYLFFK